MPGPGGWDPYLQLPFDRSHATCLEQLICLGKMSAAKEAAMGAQPRGVRTHQGMVAVAAVDERCLQVKQGTGSCRSSPQPALHVAGRRSTVGASALQIHTAHRTFFWAGLPHNMNTTPLRLAEMVVITLSAAGRCQSEHPLEAQACLAGKPGSRQLGACGTGNDGAAHLSVSPTLSWRASLHCERALSDTYSASARLARPTAQVHQSPSAFIAAAVNVLRSHANAVAAD